MIYLSPDYLDQLKEVHATRQWGASGYSHAEIILKWMRETGSETILDYGCGRATLKPTLLKLDPGIKQENIFEYDPAIEGKDKPPSPADMLVANDVLEHIEPRLVRQSLTYIRSLAKKAAYFTIALTPSKVLLPDGTNSHLTLWSEEEWKKSLHEAGFIIVDAKMRKGLWVWAK